MKESSHSLINKLPTIDGQIDWDRVAPDYFQYILSPYAPEMVGKQSQKLPRNLLLNYLHKISQTEISGMRVLDFGCGPGNLLAHIDKSVASLVGIDKSHQSLKIASKLADQYGINFSYVCDDILNVNDEEGFDLIISSNSVLPDSREEVIAIFKKLNSLLSVNGKLLAILPSFDTTLYLKSLREEAGELNQNEETFMDEARLAYADDGCHMQCYHTPDSIMEETALAGLILTTSPQKVFYPWELCRKFGYGYYPQSQQEIWDWFVVAEKKVL